MHVRKANLSCFHPNGALICLLLQIAVTCSYLGHTRAENGYSGKPIPAAVNSRYSVSVKKVDLPSTKPYSPGTIEVKGAVPSFVIKFNSASSKVNLFHEHQSEKAPSPKESFSEDEPQILKHEVTKPIIQEVHEIISPVRRIVQEIKPVIETIDTIVATNSNGQGQQSVASLNSPRVGSSLADNLSMIFGKQAPSSAITEEDGDNLEQGKPDLVLDEENLIDNSLYNGNSELELKYVSPNGKTVSAISHNDFEPKMYKDR